MTEVKCDFVNHGYNYAVYVYADSSSEYLLDLRKAVISTYTTPRGSNNGVWLDCKYASLNYGWVGGTGSFRLHSFKKFKAYKKLTPTLKRKFKCD